MMDCNKLQDIKDFIDKTVNMNWLTDEEKVELVKHIIINT